MKFKKLSKKKIQRIKAKCITGVIFSFFATLAYTFFKCKSIHWNVLVIDLDKVATTFLVFFLIGYVIIGNSFAPE